MPDDQAHRCETDENATGERIPEHVARAAHIAHSGRPGPAVLVMPEDVLRDRTAATPVRAPAPARPEMAERDRVLLSERLQRAHRPVLVVGGPGWTQEIGERVAAVAERESLPLVSAFRWQDAVDNRSPAYAGYLGLGTNPRLRRHIEDWI